MENKKIYPIGCIYGFEWVDYTISGIMILGQRGVGARFKSTFRPCVPACILYVRYEMLLNGAHDREVRYSTMVHELAHLYCGHLGAPDRRWWPDRTGLGKDVCEFEAESVSYLVCLRFGIETPSETYLATYIDENERLPKISLECIMKSAGLIESMGKKNLIERKKS